jgi:hypothetical protein
MNTQADIELLAEKKLKEAMCLFDGNCMDGAYYMAGYVIELLLKARICKTLNVPDFFMFKPERGKSETFRPFKSHDYDQLLLLSGLYADFNTELQTNPILMAHWSVICVWNEGSRYSTGKSYGEVESFITSIKEISSWIRKHL